jgi:hypothetical protein
MLFLLLVRTNALCERRTGLHLARQNGGAERVHKSPCHLTYDREGNLVLQFVWTALTLRHLDPNGVCFGCFSSPTR